MRFTDEITKVDKNLIPIEIQNDVKAYIKTKRQERITRAKIQNYNSKHPDKKKEVVTKYAHEVSRLYWKIKWAWEDHFFPKSGEKVSYFGKDNKIREATVLTRNGDIVTLKISNGHIMKRYVDELYHKYEFGYTDVFESMRLA